MDAKPAPHDPLEHELRAALADAKRARGRDYYDAAEDADAAAA